MGRHHVKADVLLKAAEDLRDMYARPLGLGEWQIAVELGDGVELARSGCYGHSGLLLATCTAGIRNRKALIIVNRALGWDLEGKEFSVSLPHTIIHELWHIVEADSGLDAAHDRAVVGSRVCGVCREDLQTHLQNLSAVQHDLCDRVALALRPVS